MSATSRWKLIPLTVLTTACILAGILVGSSSSQDQGKSEDAEARPLRDAEKWLGPQDLRKPNMEDTKEIEDLYRIRLRVISGEDLAAVKGLHNVVYLRESKISVAPEEWQQTIDKDAKYLFGRISRRGIYGVRIYTLDCRIESGPLKGAIVHLRNDRFGPGEMEYAAFFQVPQDVEIDFGRIEFKVVRRWWK